MRKFLSLLVVLLTTVATATNAQILVEGIYYSFDETAHTATVKANTSKYTGTLNIPEKVTYNSSEYTVTKIDEDCFIENTELVSVTIPNTVQKIMAGAFDKCSGLTTVIIGSSVEAIGDDAFRKCTSLTSVYDYATEPQDLSYCDPSPFKDSNISNCTLYVPQASKSKYETATYWKDFKEIKEAPAPNYLCFTADEATDVSFNINGTLTTTPSLQYSKDMATWTNYSFTAGDNHTISLAAGEKVYFKATTTNSTFSESGTQYITFKSTDRVAASGNIMSLLDATCESKTIPADYSFFYLFNGCTSLTTAPELHATTLSKCCYSGMFYGCTSLTTAPELPAPILVNYCYQSMFHGCTSLTATPNLPVTTLAEGCYSGMFNGCTSLTTAPELPATTLVKSCYQRMFNGCTSLTTAPVLPATTLADRCYNNMFYGCTSLNKVTVNFTDWNTSGSSTSNWLKDAGTDESVTSRTFICPEGLDIETTRGVSNVPLGWTVAHPDYLCFTAEEATDVAFNVTGTLTTTPTLQYSTDKTTWKDYSFTAGANHTISLAAGEKLYFKATTTNSTFSKSGDDYITFSSTKKVAASGNIMSLLDATCESKTVPAFAFSCLFQDCTGLTAAPALPATELAEYCYSFMFQGTDLTTAPALPATELAEYCYHGMFAYCTSLTIAPVLPATELAKRCYSYMFCSCTSLTTAPELPATTLAELCYCSMFQGCTSLIINKAANTDKPGIEWKINAETVGEDALTDMFTETGGTLTGDPTSGTTYYIASLPAVQLNSKGYATYSSAQKVDIETAGVKAYTATVSGSTITLNEIASDNYIPAGVGVVLYGCDDMANKVVKFKSPVNTTAASTTDNALKSTLVDVDGTAGAYKVDAKPSSGTVWSLGTEDSFLKDASTAFIANSAYIVHEPATGVEALKIGSSTAINKVNANVNAATQKVVKTANYIIKNGKKYNFAGQRVK